MTVISIFKENFLVCNIALSPVERRLVLISSQVCDVSVEVVSDRLFEELLCYLLFARDRRNFPLVMMEDNKFDFVSTTYNDLVFVLNTLPNDWRHEIEGQVEVANDPLPEWMVH